MSSSAAPDQPPGESGTTIKHPAPPSPWGAQGQRSLLRPSTLALLFVAMGFILVMLFPGENYNDPRYTARADGVSVAYLRAILKVRPNDPEPRLVLARQLLSLALLDDALAVLKPLLGKTRVTLVDAELLALEAEERGFFVIPADEEDRRDRQKARVFARIDRLLGLRLPAATLERLARVSLGLGEPARAAQVYLKLARVARNRREDYLEEAGRWLRAAGENQAAARVLRDAAIARRDRPEQAVAVGLKAVDALLAANRPRDALELLEELRKLLGGGPQMLDRGWKLALSVGDLDRALLYAILRAATFPNDLKIQQALRDLGLSRHHMPEALGAAKAIVRLRPDDPVERRKLAQVARWSGDLVFALDSLVWLARHGDVEAVDEALLIARVLLDWERLIEMLTMKAERQGLTPEELAELARAYEALANPEAASVAVRRYGDPDDRRTWELLAGLYGGSGKVGDEIEVWEQIDERFGARLPDLMRQIELQYRRGTGKNVWKLLQGGRKVARPEDVGYWRTYAELAWARDAVPDALLAHRMLYASGKADPYEIARLLLLLGQIGDRDELLALARTAWGKLQKPSYLLLAMQAAADGERFAELEALLALADGRIDLFKDSEQYWLLRAGFLAWKRRPQEVEAAYRTALRLNPVSRDARIAWLGYALQENRRERLQQLLSAWWELAVGDPGYARHYAAALDRLGRLEDALPFYEQGARARPRDLAWLEVYADALERSGRVDGARRLRELVLARRQQEAGPVLAAWSRKSSTQDREMDSEASDEVRLDPRERAALDAASSPEPLLAYARLLRQLRGVGVAGPVTDTLMRAGAGRPEVQVLRLETELARGNLPALRRWLWRRQEETPRTRPPLQVRLALALAENDHETLAAILETEAAALPIGDRLTVLRQLGRQATARKLVAERLEAEPQGAELAALQGHARDLILPERDTLSVRALVDRLGPLDVIEQRAAHERPAPWEGGRLAVEGAHLYLRPQRGSILVRPPESRGILTVSALQRGPRLSGGVQLGFEGGAAAGSTLRGRLDGTLRLPELGGGSNLGLTLGLHETAREGAVLRTLGLRDRLAAILELHLTSREQVRAQLEVRRDVIFGEQWVARGGAFTLEASHNLLTGSPNLRVYAQGIAAANQRAALLPGRLVLNLVRGATLDAVLPDRYMSAALGIALARGDLSLLPLAPPHLSWALDFSAGWLWPAGQLALRSDAALSWRFFPGQLLSGRIFLSRSQGGRAGETERGLELGYGIFWD